MIDLRSDTVTKPTAEMVAFMSKAEVGDDVFAEDPTAEAFQDKMAKLFGFEKGLFVPSGTMSNQLCVALITEPGDEIIIHETGHIFNYEASSAAWLSSVQIHPLAGKEGRLELVSVEQAIRTKNEWDPWTKVISIENTANRGGGTYYRKDELAEFRHLADKHNLRIHLDGARIWNAIIASGIDPMFFGTIADTMSICFSKGLGAPVGSMMLMSSTLFPKARRLRKMIGGGMRQVGLLAAAADYGVTNHWILLEQDHRRAKELAEVIKNSPLFSINPESVESNIIIFDTQEPSLEVVTKLKEQAILAVPFGTHKVRLTYHFQITEEMHQKVLNVIKNYI